MVFPQQASEWKNLANFHFQCQRDEEGRRNAAQVRERDGRRVTQRKRDANNGEYHASEE